MMQISFHTDIGCLYSISKIQLEVQVGKVQHEVPDGVAQASLSTSTGNLKSLHGIIVTCQPE